MNKARKIVVETPGQVPVSQTCSVMPQPNTGIIQSWRSVPCGGCGRRKEENEILVLRKNAPARGQVPDIRTIVIRLGSWARAPKRSGKGKLRGINSQTPRRR